MLVRSCYAGKPVLAADIVNVNLHLLMAASRLRLTWVQMGLDTLGLAVGASRITNIIVPYPKYTIVSQ